jgi:hypothetical protein
MGGIVLIAIVAIISGTIIKLRRMQIEKDHLVMGKEGDYPQGRNRKQNPAAIEELNRRLENLETIIAAGDINSLPEAGEAKEMKEQIKLLARRISELEHENFKDDPY